MSCRLSIWNISDKYINKIRCHFTDHSNHSNSDHLKWLSCHGNQPAQFLQRIMLIFHEKIKTSREHKSFYNVAFNSVWWLMVKIVLLDWICKKLFEIWKRNPLEFFSENKNFFRRPLIFYFFYASSRDDDNPRRVN